MRKEQLVSADKLKFIESVVEKVRTERGIKPSPGLKLEGSCFGARGGEMANMFWVQLVHTTNQMGEWSLLSDPVVLENLYSYVSSLDIQFKRQ